jgi:hypothetical protein
MGVTNPLIISVSTPEYKKVVVETSDGMRYFADLSTMSPVYCFPKTTDWDKVSPDSYGLALIWVTRFEVHVDQVIGLAYKTEQISRSA